jgi:DUF2934 family protein
MASKSRNVTPPTTRPAAPRTTSPAAADRSSLNHAKSPGRSEASPDEIRDRAYFLWEEAGRPDGDGVQFWLAAERELCGPR